MFVIKIMAKCFGDIGRMVPVLEGIPTCIECCIAAGSTNPEKDGIEMLDAIRIDFDGEGDYVHAYIPGNQELAEWYEDNVWKLFQYLKNEWGFPEGQEFFIAF